MNRRQAIGSILALAGAAPLVMKHGWPYKRGPIEQFPPPLVETPGAVGPLGGGNGRIWYLTESGWGTSPCGPFTPGGIQDLLNATGNEPGTIHIGCAVRWTARTALEKP